MKIQIRALLILLCIGLGYGSYAGAESAAAKKFMELNETLNVQKTDWFNFMKKADAEKAELLKKHHIEWSNWRNQNVKNFDEGNFTTQEAKNIELEKQFKEKLALHKAQAAEWSTIMRAQVTEAEELAKKHAKQIEDKFEPKPKKKEKDDEKSEKDDEEREIIEEEIDEEDLY